MPAAAFWDLLLPLRWMGVKCRAVPCCGLFSPAGLLETYPGPVAAMSAQFPDPHFKKRHKKRRMVQPSVVQVARERLMPGGEIDAPGPRADPPGFRGLGLRGAVLAAISLWRCPCHTECVAMQPLSALLAGPQLW